MAVGLDIKSSYPAVMKNIMPLRCKYPDNPKQDCDITPTNAG